MVRDLESKQSLESQVKVDELGSQLAQIRERLNELDRAVTAMSDHMASTSTAHGAGDNEFTSEPDRDKFVDSDSFHVVQGLLNQLQQEHERLMGTAAHLSHELDINKEHVKVSYMKCGGNSDWTTLYYNISPSTVSL